MKICAQCGQNKPLDQFRKYAPRGKGVYNTNVGTYTICRSCEQLGRDVKALMAKGHTDFTDLGRLFKQPGWVPKLKPIRDALGVKRTCSSQSVEERYKATVAQVAISHSVEEIKAFIYDLEDRTVDSPTDLYARNKELDASMRELKLYDVIKAPKTVIDDGVEVEFDDDSTVYEYAQALFTEWEEE